MISEGGRELRFLPYAQMSSKSRSVNRSSCKAINIVNLQMLRIDIATLSQLSLFRGVIALHLKSVPES